MRNSCEPQQPAMARAGLVLCVTSTLVTQQAVLALNATATATAEEGVCIMMGQQQQHS
jgi:hypothetical protein